MMKEPSSRSLKEVDSTAVSAYARAANKFKLNNLMSSTMSAMATTLQPETNCLDETKEPITNQ